MGKGFSTFRNGCNSLHDISNKKIHLQKWLWPITNTSWTQKFNCWSNIPWSCNPQMLLSERRRGCWSPLRPSSQPTPSSSAPCIVSPRRRLESLRPLNLSRSSLSRGWWLDTILGPLVLQSCAVSSQSPWSTWSGPVCWDRQPRNDGSEPARSKWPRGRT